MLAREILQGLTLGAMLAALGFLRALSARLGLDPATSSTPFIKTLVDVIGIFLYLNLARIMLGDVLARLPGSG